MTVLTFLLLVLVCILLANISCLLFLLAGIEKRISRWTVFIFFNVAGLVAAFIIFLLYKDEIRVH